MLLTIAAADTLDFVRFDLTGSASGVSLEYVLAADDWVAIAQNRAQGVATSVSVTLRAADYSYTAVVPLNAPSRQVDLSVRPWPTGTEGQVEVRQGAYDQLAVPGSTAKQVRIAVAGGLEGARPANAPLSSDSSRAPAVNPQPVTSLPPAPVMPEPEPEPVPAPAPAAAPATSVEPSTPTSVIEACKRSFSVVDEQGRCIAQLFGRPQGDRELEACVALGRPRYVRTCIDTAALRSASYEATIRACTTGLGASGDALDCVRIAADHPDDPVPDILACTTHVSDPGEAVGCIKRAGRISYPLAPLMRACSIGFASSPLDCLARASRSSYDRADLVTACTVAFDQADRERCVSLLAPAGGPDAGGAVRACVKLYDGLDLRFECMERARAQPNEARVLHCGTLKSRTDQLDCIGR